MKRFLLFALLFTLLLLFGLLLLFTLILMSPAHSPEIAQEPSPSPPQLSASPPQTEQPHLTRPPQIDQVVELFQGVTYTRDARQTPRPLMVHFVTVDLTAPGIRVLVTPGGKVDELEIPARTTSEFLKEFGVQQAINGSFFRPFEDDYPQRGDPVDVIGLAISNGVTYSSSETGVGVLCILADNHVQINEEHCPPDTTQALAGGAILVDHSTPFTSEDVPQDGLHPRTAVAIDEGGETLWLIVVDGRQSGYSEGVAVVELAYHLAHELGADMALNLDGGGSTTLVVSDGSSPRTLNAPIHAGVPMLQRPVANHLGIYALPKTP